MTTPSRDRYTVRIASLGDSIVEGFGSFAIQGWEQGSYALAWGPGGLKFYWTGVFFKPGLSNTLLIDPFNSGSPGTTIAGLRYFDQQAYRADVSIVASGTNDAAAGQTGAQMLTSMTTMLDTIYGTRMFPWSKIVLFNCLRRLDAFDAAIQVYNAGLPALVAGKSYAAAVSLVDQYNALTNAQYGDTVHPNDAGYAVLAPIYYNAVAPVAAAIKAST